MSRPLFSVVIPTFNSEKTVLETLESVRSQIFRDFETIVVDDGSSDGTVAILRRYDWIFLIQQDNRGPGSARNRGAKEARGIYLVFLDSDDLWFPWTLKTIAETITRYNHPSAIAAAMVEFSDHSELDGITDRPLEVKYTEDFLSTQPKNDCIVGAGMTVVTMKLFEELNGFSTVVRNCEDHDFILRAGIASGFAKVLTPITMAWRRHVNSTTYVLDRTVKGVKHLVSSEIEAQYPGGLKRELERKAFITARVRPVVLECARSGKLRDSWRLYLSILSWHLRLKRWRFIFGYFFYLTGFAYQRMLGSIDAN